MFRCSDVVLPPTRTLGREGNFTALWSGCHDASLIWIQAEAREDSAHEVAWLKQGETRKTGSPG
jgi:hypothetical protein